MNCPELVTPDNRELPQVLNWISVLCLKEEQLKERQKRAFFTVERKCKIFLIETVLKDI